MSARKRANWQIERMPWYIWTYPEISAAESMTLFCF